MLERESKATEGIMSILTPSNANVPLVQMPHRAPPFLSAIKSSFAPGSLSMPLPPASCIKRPFSAINASRRLTESSSSSGERVDPGTGTRWNRLRLSCVRTPA